ncbi:ABC transporter ATP-binding protein [Dactylosporangium sucinum]|uniref:ABC transporter ATP-binding protein n=1 Tax=Dactylosporangium sucinum TaxID=1424081 RepID=A0A917X495_9ACTN|nr:ABC transporter ATP-binding protein [Dactylosporangium sucinum]GGM69758.1 ABC transporter ATP-binding protein [Dactylosporangium sucinum]
MPESDNFHVSGLTVRAAGPDRPALVSGVELTVAPGQLLGIVGETGAGKTLTIRAMLGLLPANLRGQGRVRFRGREPIDVADLPRLRAALGRRITCALQNPMTMLDPRQRVGRQIVEGVVHTRLLTRREARERAHRLLARMGFRDPERVTQLYPHQLSGGMAQRVVLAGCLMPEPEVVVLDEPTSALDAQVRVEVLELLREAATDSNTAIVMIGHDLTLMRQFSDRIVVMYSGEIVERGATPDVIRAPAHPYTEALIACSAMDDSQHRQRLATIPGTVPAPSERPSGCWFHPRCRHAVPRCAGEHPSPTVLGDRAVACHLPRLPGPATVSAADASKGAHHAGGD